jgi:hypothetical protein
MTGEVAAATFFAFCIAGIPWLIYLLVAWGKKNSGQRTAKESSDCHQ